MFYAKQPLGFRWGCFWQSAGNQRVARHAVTLLLLLSACRPASYEQFVRADQAPGGVYEFRLDMGDSLATYDLSLYTRVDAGLLKADEPARSLGLEICWSPAGAETAPAPVMSDLSSVMSDLASVMPDFDRASLPDSISLRETVYLPYGGKAGSTHLYRSGIRPSPAGEWRLVIRPTDPPEGLRGIGIICKRHD